jgi:RNA-binding protein
MQFIGEIENISYNGMWILRSQILPRIGSNVYNQQKQVVGKVMNVIGPVSSPYILVKPKSKEKFEQLQIIGEKMYIIKEGKSKKRIQKR